MGGGGNKQRESVLVVPVITLKLVQFSAKRQEEDDKASQDTRDSVCVCVCAFSH